MKKILGLDLGTTSIGWAYVNEAETKSEKSSIVKLGVRVIPLSTDEEGDFLKGKSVSINADRTLKRGARRNLDRYQLRRKALISILINNGFISDNSILSEEGKNTTFSTYRLRSKAVKEKIAREDFAKVLLMINKKRGYKSSRKTKIEEEGVAIEGMDVAIKLHEEKITPGQYVYELLKNGEKGSPDFYRSDLQNELLQIWNFQKQYYSNILTEEFKDQIIGKGKRAVSQLFFAKYEIYTADNNGKRDEVKLRSYKWRVDALSQQLEIDKIAYVISEVNNNINSSSGYLGAISDRSKELYFNKLTVGEYLYNQIKFNQNSQLKNQVFYRQDYLEEFNTIWEKQREYYSEYNDKLKNEIRDVIIFYQRRLKSQKHLISNCEFEINHKVIPKSSPLFQEFKIWQILNNLEFKDISTGEKYVLNQDLKEMLFSELSIKTKLTDKDVLKLITDNPKNYKLNYKEVEGNRTNAAFYVAYSKILDLEGEEFDFSKMRSDEVNEIVSTKFLELGINVDVLSFDSSIKGNDFDKQAIMQLWHLLYSFEGDNSNSGNENLYNNLEKRFGYKREYARIIADVSLQEDHGNLSSRAIRKILPSLIDGNMYDIACGEAGYNHSTSLTSEEIEKRILKDKLELLPKNSLRNPVVEKILNQMVNVINAIIDDENLGKPDEIRIELARELKKSAKERSEMTQNINKATAKNDKIRKLLHEEFGISKVTRNDIIRYKLWKEQESSGFKTIYTNTYISKEELFSKKFDIEHIIPKAKIFDDSFSNKTLSARQINLDKSDETAYDFLKVKLSDEEFEHYLSRVEKLFKDGSISKAKHKKLLTKTSEISDGFIERDLRNSQYIAKKAKEMLEEVVRSVSTTTGIITDRLRSDWQLVNIMKELNLPKYERLGLVDIIEGKDGQLEKRIRDWTKRNDHRHHAMDALTVAFTKPGYIQYLNNLHARSNRDGAIYGIEQKNLHRENGKLVFNSPISINEFRIEAKNHLEGILISFKAKNKVVTRNKNKISKKGKEELLEKIELTPRGQLHKETVYGKISQYESRKEKVGIKFNIERINLVAKKAYREVLIERLLEFSGDPKKAFGGKNSPSKNPIYLDGAKKMVLPEKVKLVWKAKKHTIRKDIAPDLKVDKVIDIGVKKILQNRLVVFNGDAKKAFSNLDEDPIWLNREKGICIKRVTISGVSNAEPLHYKKDHNGNDIVDEQGKKQDVDFVSTGNNHHVAIYRDKNGDLQDKVVSFFEAVERSRQGLPIINKTFNQEIGWIFLFSMKQNEYFIFPNDSFDPNEVDLFSPLNSSFVSPYLFRLQKFSKVEYGNSSVRDYVFRNHLETQILDKNETKGITFIVVKSLPKLAQIVKVRINHLGIIVKIGEY